MSKTLVLGATALAFSAAGASAQVYTTPDYYDYVAPVADLAAPAYGYAVPTYVAPAPVDAAPQIYTAPPVTTGYYAAPAVSGPIYNYAPDYYGYGWR
jgi:hypothetical protein